MSDKVEGPFVSKSCHGCNWHDQERYQVQGDTGYDHYCTHSGERKHMRGDAKTPEWCPVPIRRAFVNTGGA